MNPTQPKTLDKENEILAEPSLARQGLKTTKTPVLSSTVQSALKPKTNYQHPVKNIDSKKSILSRTFSETNNNSPTITATSAIAIHPEPRSRSLTRRGSAKTGLIIHKDKESSTLQKIVKNDDKLNNTTVIVGINTTASAQIESTSTLLSIERGIESQEQVVVGAAEADTKRRALTNDDDLWDIEYCPPPVEEEKYDPGFDLDTFALSTIPPAQAFHIRTIDSHDIGLPTIEPAQTMRSRSPIEPIGPKEAQKKESSEVEQENGSMPKARRAPNGNLEFTWSDDEDDQELYPQNGRRFGIKDLHDHTKTLPPFDGFIFDIEGSSSEDSLSDDEDDIHGGAAQTTDPQTKEFNEAFGLGDLEDESKVAPDFTDFKFEV
ncbi:hypothetical protein BGZ65_005688 [Modicella reniformis]|uniref:Uncharacterized protein n=1 Tax=Modicella reniformis TaxID=1440133 RepID=A0A9P6LS76_9FUNG|nr:hypothetical protein BGZ65_005688 [Modicella reniformis]